MEPQGRFSLARFPSVRETRFCSERTVGIARIAQRRFEMATFEGGDGREARQVGSKDEVLSERKAEVPEGTCGFLKNYAK
ncbi:MAG: hypothetical protein DLM68_13610 [Hyphomicrobiales bacterium]|nr:MAG: hypothetical protein DLM68_13610 [Hyphomicrobiales bacterium]